MYFFLKYLVTLFYKKLRIKIVLSFLCESGPRALKKLTELSIYKSNMNHLDSSPAEVLRRCRPIALLDSFSRRSTRLTPYRG